MKSFRKLLAWGLSLCLLLGLVPTALAEGDTGCTVTLTGNTGAEIVCDFTPLSAEVDDNDLAIVELRGNTVRVLGKEGALGVTRLSIQSPDGYRFFDIPIGYTTFVFDGDKLTVVPGSDSNYQVTGINAAGQEYSVGSTDYPLPETVDAAGNKVYENSDDYKLLVTVAKTGGSYVFTGSGSDGAIAVKKGATAPAVLMLAGLELSSSFTAPLTVRKDSSSTVTLTALGGFVNTLSDAAFNNADNYGPTEEGGDGSNAEYAESAVIKAKSGAQLTLNGAGTLRLVCSSKNALKVGASGSLTIDGLCLDVSSVKNGISSDNTLTVNGGEITVSAAGGDCIRSDPDAVDAAAGCAGCITITGGSFTLQAASDGIQAAQDLTISGGSFEITTGSGWNDSAFNKDTMSCKGLKASCNATDAESSGEEEETEATNHITISGGSFVLNTADDAIHSDAYVEITGGTFSIQTGDDGVHGDTQADFGTANGPDCAVQLSVLHSYEGLEAKDVYVKSGCYDIISSDDGINAAGGSSNGGDPGGGGGDPWHPGPGGDTGDYSLTVSGGMVNVNAGGDGLDSNGNETLSGGSIIVWGAASNGSASDNSPLDCDGTLLINGATIFAAGSRQMAESPGSGSQPYVRYGSSGGPGGGGGSSITAGKTVVVKNSSSQTVFSIKAVKTVNYALYSAPSMSSSSGWSISADSSTPTAEKVWAEHSYGAYTQTQAPSCTAAGENTAVCALCGDTVRQSVAPTGHSWSYVTVPPTQTAEGYDLYSCALCGGQYRTNFTDPTGDPDPCPNGHSWDEGTVTTPPSCTAEGVRTYTCTVCGETTTAPVAALGHDYNDSTGVCSRCSSEAFRATFECSEGVSVTVFRTQDLSTGGTENADFAFPRSGDSGVIDVSGSGQVNFLVVPAEGYSVESVTVTPTANYKNLKLPSELGVENAYRITKLTGPVTVTVTASTQVCDHAFDDEGVCIHCGLEAPKVSFACDEHSWVTAYPTQDLSTGGTDHAAFAIARNSTTGEICIDGTGQVNFVLHLDEGWTLDSMTAEPASAYKNLKDNGDGSYRITKISGHLTLSVTTVSDVSTEPWEDCDGEAHCPGRDFADMPPVDHWAHKPIDWAVSTGVTAGTSANSFSPDAFCTRAQVMTFLWRAAGSPAPGTGESPFTDVAEDAYYRNAVLWAVENGITAGSSETTFSPGWSCTRAQVMTFLWRAAGSPAPGTGENPFTDVAEDAYYRNAVLWAAENGITAGTSETTFSPDSFCTRAQVVTFLFRAFVR